MEMEGEERLLREDSDGYVDEERLVDTLIAVEEMLEEECPGG